MNSEIIQGNWDIAKGKLKQKYSKLTDNDLRFVDGKEDELIGRLEKVTGEAREELEKFLKDERNYR
ncbi:MAG TPA: CsbD family protein [Opitutaceae bacterium]